MPGSVLVFAGTRPTAGIVEHPDVLLQLLDASNFSRGC